MAGRTMDVSVLVRLVDRLTGPLRAIQNRIAGLAALGQRIGILGAAAAAISFMAPINSAAAFDQKLRDNVVTAGYWGNAAETQIRRISSGVSQLALHVGIASNQLADARGLLIAAGMEEALTDRLLPTIGRVSKAASAVPDDVAKVVFALNNTLGISSEAMEQELAKLVTAGKLGRFEFRDMAKEIPGLSAQLAKLGITGSEAVATLGASLQVAMFGTDMPAAAANNFKNFLSKILSPETVKKFEDMGVNIMGVMQNAAAQGINPMEAAIQKILSLTGMSARDVQQIYQANKAKGMNDAQATAAALQQIEKIAGAGKLGQLFGDMQVLDFLLPFLANVDKYLAYKDEIATAGLDVIAKDYATQWEGLSTQLTISGEIGEQVLRRIGIAFGSNLKWINQWGIAALQWAAQIDERWPGMIDLVLSWGGAFLAAIAGLALMVPVLSILSAAFGVLASIVGVVLSPLGLVVAVLAGAAYLIYRNWDRLGPYFSNLWTSVVAAFQRGYDRVRALAQQFGGGLVTYLRSLFSGDWSGMTAGLGEMGSSVATLLGDINGLFGQAGAAVRRFAEEQLGGLPGQIVSIIGGVWIAISSAFSAFGSQIGGILEPVAQAVLDWARGLPARIAGAFGETGTSALAWLTDLGGQIRTAVTGAIDELSGMSDEEWATLGTRLGNSLADSVRAAVDALGSFFTGLPGRIMDWVGSINIGSLIKWPTLPSWLGGGSSAPAAGNDNSPGAAPQPNVAPAPQPGGGGIGSAQVGGQIVVSAAPGAKVESVQSTNPAVPLKAANSRMVGRV